MDAAKAESCHVLLGFRDCSFIDSSGLAVLVAASRSLAERDRQLLLYGVHGQVRRMFEVTELAETGPLISSRVADASASHPKAPDLVTIG